MKVQVQREGAREAVSADHLAFETRAHDRADCLCAYLALALCHILPNLTLSLRVLLSPPLNEQASRGLRVSLAPRPTLFDRALWAHPPVPETDQLLE